MSSRPDDKELLKDFKWIQEEAPSERPHFEESPVVNRSLGSLLKRKFNENALVPVGILATTICLVMGLRSMTRGDAKEQQFYMRGRVMFQALTFVAMGSGIVIAALSGKERKRRRDT